MCNVNKELVRLLDSESMGYKNKVSSLVEVFVQDRKVTEEECNKIIEVIKLMVKERGY